MILLLGGTHEGRDIATLLNKLNMVYTLSVATELGHDLYRDIADKCIIRRFTKDDLIDYIASEGVSLIIDATHPHALAVKDTAMAACIQSGIPYYRYARRIDDIENEKIVKVTSMEQAINYLKSKVKAKDKILVTGSKHVPDFLKAFDPKQCVFRIMPGNESMKICMDHQVPIENILAVKAPCSVAFNQVVFKDFDIAYFVFKNSGSGSAVSSNLQSLRGQSVLGIVIEPERKNTPHVYETLEALKLAIMDLIALNKA